MRAIHTIHTRETAHACRATTSTRIPWALAALLVAACSGGSDDNANPADAAVAADAPPNTLTEAEQAAGWQLLFKGTVVSGWQAEVAPPDLFSGGIYESYGRGWLVQPDPALDAALRMGDWNTMRVRAVGDRVTTWLNGTRMVDFDDEKIGEAEGSIALQIHDGGGIKMRWRNLRVVDLGG